jgi:glutamate-1-semialdehyde 2,1-aminomutase
MPDLALSNSPVVAAYRAATPGSAALAAQAQTMFPSGINHDSRDLDPYPVFVQRAQGAHKWDVDGNRLVDYFGGHGALLLGHNHPVVTAAAQAQLALGTHFGACHPLEVRWGELVRQLVPSAERVRFTASGTEATLMALRLARAFTGRAKLLRVKGHFHGWHDHMTSGYAGHFDGTPTPGVLADIAAQSVLVEPNDPEGLEAAFAREGGALAAAIVEPTGAAWGRSPLKPSFLEAIRRLTRETGALLIMDEVVTGFRVSPGGAQAALGVTPDLTTLAKILAGGLPGGALAGRADVMELLDFAATKAKGREKVHHPGTYNANPLSAAAGVAALEIIATTDACARASATAAAIRDGINRVFAEMKVPFAAHGTYSGFHIFTNPRAVAIDPLTFDPYAHADADLRGNRPGVAHKLRLGLLANGVDIAGGPGGSVSAVHDAADVETTVKGFAAALRLLRQEGEV